MLSVAEPAARLGAYQRLSRLLFPRSYLGKIFLLTFVLAHIPLMTLVGYLLWRSDLGGTEARNLVLVGLAATIVGITLTYAGLWVLLAPVAVAARTLDEFRRYAIAPALPAGLSGEGGQLLADVHHTLTHLGTLIAQLRESASRDELTGVLNRREGERRLRAEMPAVRHGAWRLALIVMDGDGMKAVNDRWGHVAGDTCIRHLAAAIVRRIGTDGWVARWGGDEFIAVLRERKGGPSPEAILEQITQDLLDRPALLPSGEQVCVVLSAGVAYATPEDEEPVTLLERADAALYQAKRNRGPELEKAKNIVDASRFRLG